MVKECHMIISERDEPLDYQNFANIQNFRLLFKLSFSERLKDSLNYVF